jgi:hypothetical protein
LVFGFFGNESARLQYEVSFRLPFGYENHQAPHHPRPRAGRIFSRVHVPQGSVEAMVQGVPEAVSAMLAWAQQGPERARVERTEVSDADGDYTGFQRMDAL